MQSLVEPAGPNPDLVEDPVNILREKAQGRIFPGTSWFDGKHLKCVCRVGSIYDLKYISSAKAT